MSLSSSNLRLRKLLKKLMKKHGYTYKDLADLWQLSESSVKRIMSQEDFSLERLIALADWMGYSLPQLLQLAEMDEAEPHAFTDEQDVFFAQNPVATYLYLRVLAGESLDSFSESHTIPRRSLLQYLVKMDKLNLVRLMPGDKAHALLRGPYQWKPDGAMVKKYARPFIEKVFHFFTAKYPREETNDAIVRPFELYLTQKSLEELVTELREIILKFRNRTNTEMALEKIENLKVISGLMIAGEFNGWEAILMTPKR